MTGGGWGAQAGTIYTHLHIHACIPAISTYITLIHTMYAICAFIHITCVYFYECVDSKSSIY